jgi:hypothetical protein
MAANKVKNVAKDVIKDVFKETGSLPSVAIPSGESISVLKMLAIAS